MEYLDFEKPIQELEEQLEKCLLIGEESDIDVSETCEQIEKKLEKAKKDKTALLQPGSISAVGASSQQHCQSNHFLLPT